MLGVLFCNALIFLYIQLASSAVSWAKKYLMYILVYVWLCIVPDLPCSKIHSDSSSYFDVFE